MALRNIVKIGDPLLAKKCREQKKFDDKLATLLDDMKETMYNADGAGLAAPQVAVLRRICVVDPRDEINEYVELINPVIMEREGCQEGVEACLSVPKRMGLVERPMRITVKAQNRYGEEFTLKAEGFFARAICHEMDHLDGVLYTDIMEREVYPEEIEQKKKVKYRRVEKQEEQA